MGNILGHLEPKRVWEIFEEILAIPRPSKKEDKITAYLKEFSAKNNLDFKQDRAGNVIISKNATSGYENRQTVILQSHLDMVCEKDSDVKHDFDKDPIIPRIDEGWVRATGTTLGADDGIGIAVQLAILESSSIEHGPIECLFTVDEETGLTGAFALEKGFLTGKILLNLDSEDDGELFIGCAGGHDTLATFPYEKVNPEIDHDAYLIKIGGLQGGHSGDDINKGRGNAVKIINRLLWNFDKMFEMRLSNIDAGNLRNAIAREAVATITLPKRHSGSFNELFTQLVNAIKLEQKTKEPNLFITAEMTAMPEHLISKNIQNKLLDSLYACPHGVIAMSPDMPGLVETSTNLASVKTVGNDIIIATSQRSSLESAKKDITNMVACVFNLAGAKVKHGDGYPGWKPDVNSNILRITKESFKNLFNEEPKVLAIHAGLECGLIGEKYPGMDMISFGPTIKGAHSPTEGLKIDTVDRFWRLTLEVLKNIPAQS
ncbi:MAG: aminoacyl-histidine dipeptidase [Bacteroidetes bacterium]|nr:aminoacyl-histidine dipeptidase [Bacteroidota bacterium]